MELSFLATAKTGAISELPSTNSILVLPGKTPNNELITSYNYSQTAIAQPLQTAVFPNLFDGQTHSLPLHFLISGEVENYLDPDAAISISMKGYNKTTLETTNLVAIGNRFLGGLHTFWLDASLLPNADLSYEIAIVCGEQILVQSPLWKFNRQVLAGEEILTLAYINCFKLVEYLFIPIAQYRILNESVKTIATAISLPLPLNALPAIDAWGKAKQKYLIVGNEAKISSYAISSATYSSDNQFILTLSTETNA
jgi:hypothetical protein